MTTALVALLTAALLCTGSGTSQPAATPSAAQTVQSSTAALQPTPYPVVNNLQGITLTVKQDPDDPGKLAPVISRAADSPDCGFGLRYWVEQQADGSWYQIPYLPSPYDRAWPDIGYWIAPGGAMEFGDIDTASLYGPLSPGRYRLVKDANTGQGETLQTFYLAAEFTIG